MARKFLFAIALVLAVVAFGPGASAANLEPEPSASPGAADVPHGPPPALADRDNNGLSDRLQGKLAGAAPGDRFDVVVTFKRPGKGAGPVGTAASAQGAVGSFLVRREFKVIPGFAATVTAAQARELANVAGVFRVEEDFQVKASLTPMTITSTPSAPPSATAPIRRELPPAVRAHISAIRSVGPRGRPISSPSRSWTRTAPAPKAPSSPVSTDASRATPTSSP